jgi:hypothetical protein
MTALQLPFRANEGKYKFLGAPNLINCFAEQQGQDGKGPLAIVPCPGMLLYSSPTDRPCRGTIFLDDMDVAYSVHSTSVYKIVEGGTATRIGVIPGTDVVQMSRNQADPVQVSIHCATGEFYIENDIVKSVTDVDLFDPVATQDNASGYTVYGKANGQFQISSLNDCSTINSTDEATAEQSADGLVRVFGDRGDLFIFGERTVEPWRNTGQADFPFEPLVALQKGLLAANGVAPCDNTLMWPGNDSIVYRLSGATAQRISTHGIERKIEADSSPADLIAFPHSHEGHSFYTLSGADWTRSYDAATSMWHSRESYGGGRWRARFPFRAWGKTIVGDELTGNLYSLDKDTFQEGTDPLVWGVDTPFLHVFPNGGIVDALHLDLATGVGLLPSTVQGYSPKVMLSWSTDGGNTFKGDRELSLGAYGNRVRVTTRRLGRFGPSGIMFRLRISDPVVRALVGSAILLCGRSWAST